MYRHTQKAPIYLVLLAVSMLMIGLGWQAAERGPVWLWLLMVFMCLVFLFLALSFAQLTVQDEGEHLLVQFGPLPVFRKRIAYDSITAVEPDRSSVLDGWGIHFVPGRGWIYNIWGFDCVKLHLVEDRAIRIGTDDPTGLTTFLRGKIEDTVL